MNCVLLPLAMCLGALPAGSSSTAPRNESISQRDLKADLFFLAGDGFRGRLTGTPENELAAEFIASRFARLGLKRMGTRGTYFLPFLLSRATLGETNTLSIEPSGSGGARTKFRSGLEFAPLRFSASGDVTGPVVSVGFGITAPEKGFDDYKRVDVKGAIVLVLDHEPGEFDPNSPFDGVVRSEASTLLSKALTAQQHGASAVLVASDVHNHPEPENFEAMGLSTWPEKPPLIDRYTLQHWVDRVHIPVAAISVGTAQAILGRSKHQLEDVARAAEKPSGSSFGDPATVLALSIDVRRHVLPDRNVLGAIEGSDPKLKDEWVVISCHHDHDGAEGSQIYNGADDNASGTVALIDIAEAYSLAAEDGERPKRSVLFASFDSEERGLLGSWAFVEQPPFRLDRIVAVLNMDMIGRDEEVPEGGGRRFRGLPIQTAESNKNSVNLLGYTRSASLTEVIENANTRFGLALKKVLDNNVSNLLGRSDQWPFLQRGVPAMFFHTGLHPDYHTDGDRPEKIHYSKMERIARLIHQASWDLANAPDRPHLDAKPNTVADSARAASQ
jgi:Zn-dependent M28 family amino/carboxypeptidase